MIGSARMTTIQPTIAQPECWPRMRSSSAQPHSRMNGVATRIRKRLRRKSDTARTYTSGSLGSACVGERRLGGLTARRRLGRQRPLVELHDEAVEGRRSYRAEDRPDDVEPAVGEVPGDQRGPEPPR